MGSTVQGDIGVRIGLSEEELNRGIARVSGALNDLAKTVEQLGKRIDQVMAQAAGETQKTAKATKELSEEEKKAAEAAKKAAEEQKRLAEEQKKAAEEARKHKKALEDLRHGLSQVATATGILTAALMATADAGLDAFKDLSTAFSGLQSAAERTGESFSEAKQAAIELAEDGLANVMNISRALQAYLITGFSLEEAKELVQISKDAAVYNRQAGLTIGEAIERMAEGIRMGNSVLSDAAGITKNLSQILKEAGYSEQDLQRVQSDSAVRQALLNGLRQEGAIFAGNAAKAAEELAGSEARAANAAFSAKAAFGEALAPALKEVHEVVTPLLYRLTEWIEHNPELVRTIVMVTGAITGMITVVAGLTAAVMALQTAWMTNPFGLAVVGIGAATGALMGLTAATEANKRAADQQRETLLDLIDDYEYFSRLVESGTLELEEETKARDELARVTKELAAAMPDVVASWQNERGEIELNTQRLRELAEEYRRVREERAKLQLETAKQEVAEAQKRLDQFLAEREWRKQFHITEALSLAGPRAQLDSNLRAQLEKEFANEAIAELNEEEMRLRSALLEAQERMLEAEAALAAIAEGGGRRRPQDTDDDKKDSGRLGSDKVASALRLLEHRRAMDQITPIEYIAGLEEIKRTYQLEAEQLMDIDERIHRTRKQLTEEEIRNAEAARKAKVQEALKLMDHERAMGRLSLEEEARRLNEMLETFELTQEERWAIEERLNRAIEQMHADWEKAAEDAARKQAQAEEERVRAAIDLINHQVAMGELSREREIEELEKHLAIEADYYRRHTDELWSIEERLYRLRQEARQEELAQVKRVAEEQRRFIKAMAEADLKALRAQQEWQVRLQEERIRGLQEEKRAAEEAAQARIRALQDELDALERLWAAEDRRNRLQELRAELAEVMADTSYQWVNPETGQVEWTYDRARARELEKQIEEAERDEERARIRERLQDQIQAERDRLDAIRRSYDEEIRYEQERLASLRQAQQQELADRQQFWADLQTMETEQLAALAEAAQEGMDAYVEVFQTTLAQLREEWANAAAAAESAAARIRAALADMQSSRSAMANLELATPTLPASLSQSVGGATSVALGGISITVNGAGSPQQTAALVATAARQGAEQGLLDALVASGRTALRTS